MVSKNFNPSQMTVSDFIAYRGMFSTYICNPDGLCLTPSQCFDLYDEDMSMELLGEGNISYRDQDCEICSYMSRIPLNLVDAIDKVVDYALDNDDIDMLDVSIEDVAEMYINNAHIYN